MNLRDLEYFITLARTEHFGKAAENCHVSQSTLSVQIQKLEETLGVQLFERTKKQVRLTEVGLQLLPQAHEILNIVQNMHTTARAAQDPLAGELQLGAFPTLAPYLYPLLVPSLKKALPKLRPVLHEDKTATLIEQLHSGLLDCALIALPVEDKRLKVEPVFTEPFFVALPPGHKLLAKNSLTLEDLRGETVLLLDEGHCLREQTLAFCTNIGVGEAGRYRATSLETLRNMVASGSGITLLPQLALKPNDLIETRPFKGNVGRTIALCWRKTDPRHALYKQLTHVLQHVIKA